MRRSGIAVYVHLIWATWDRLPLLKQDVERAIHRSIAATCRDLRAELVAVGGVEDHVHLLVGLPATVSIAELVGKVKGASSHLATHRLLSNGEFFKWQGAYGAVSISPRHLSKVADYIARQREHHAANSLLAGLELPPLPSPHPAAVAQGKTLNTDNPASDS